MPPFGEKNAPVGEPMSFPTYVSPCLLLTHLEFPGACSGITGVTATLGTRSAPERRKEMIKAPLSSPDTDGA